METDEAIFKALADSSRRALLDALQRADGQTLSSLLGVLPELSRFGVMKHLGVLEEAGLITKHKSGREVWHYLNPVPIQQVYERWVSRYAQPHTRQLTRLQSQLEAPTSMPAPYTHIYHITIRTTPERLWQALTSSDDTRHYYFGCSVRGDWHAGSRYAYLTGPGQVGALVGADQEMVTGTVLESDPPRKMVMTFTPHWVGPDAPAPLSKVTYLLEPMGELTRLTLLHEDLEPNTPLTQGMIEGWALIFSGLKTLLETGQPLSPQP
jgi:uncharacterized protein YndB with AHSA1/START domain/DNA-binding transcriptional ArsR family regulator